MPEGSPNPNQRFLSRVLLIVGIVIIIGLAIFAWLAIFGPKKQPAQNQVTPTPTDSTVFTGTPTPLPPQSLNDIVPSFDQNSFKVRTSGVIAFQNTVVGYERAVLYFRNSQLEVKEEALYDGGTEVTYLQDGNLFIVNSKQKEYYYLASGAKATTLDVTADEFKNSHPLAILYRDIKSGAIKPTRDAEGLWDVVIPTVQIHSALPKDLPAKLVLTPDQKYIARLIIYKPNTKVIYGDLEFGYERTESSVIDGLKKVPSGFRRNVL